MEKFKILRKNSTIGEIMQNLITLCLISKIWPS